jgi:hypothetical protein
MRYCKRSMARGGLSWLAHKQKPRPAIDRGFLLEGVHRLPVDGYDAPTIVPEDAYGCKRYKVN